MMQAERMGPREMSPSYSAKFVEMAAGVIATIEASIFLNRWPSSRRGKLILLKPYSCSEVSAVSSTK
jgi:hypothetical protein